ncbi:uncharacterized protein LOC117103352 [Anneissia japonica]|uniref:uncharacterized protein LOC117103352 n=1 Tax=Anneissia japonica TaxID=1529436 RepID=UPI0014254E0E|nr:uncharacterized protein LOC117103352 [Anneissia japonica]
MPHLPPSDQESEFLSQSPSSRNKAKSATTPPSPPSDQESEFLSPSPGSRNKAKSVTTPPSPPSDQESEFLSPSPGFRNKAKSATIPPSPPSDQESEFLPPFPGSRSEQQETCVKLAKSAVPPISPPSHQEISSSKGLEFQLPSPATSMYKMRNMKRVKSPPTPSSPPSSCSGKKQSRRPKPCPFPECSSVVQQLARHLRFAHKLKQKEALLLSDRANVKCTGEFGMRKCPVLGCGKNRSRVDRHLQNEHQLKINSKEYKQLMAKCKASYEKKRRKNQEESAEGKDCQYIEPMLSLFKKHLMSLNGGMVNETNADQCVSRLRKICEMVGGVSGLKNLSIMRKWFSSFQDQTTKGGKILTPNTVLIYVGTYRNFMKFAFLSKLFPFKATADALYKETFKWQAFLNPLKMARDAEVIATSMRNTLQHSEFLKLSGNYPVKNQALELLNRCEMENIDCDDKGFFTVRDYIMMLLVAKSGQRSGCIRSLTCSDILNSKESEGRQIILASRYKTASSGHAAKIVLDKSDFKVVQKYIQHIRPSVAGEIEYAFTDKNGKQLNSACFDKRLKIVWANAGNKSKFSCSQLRKSFFGSPVRSQNLKLGVPVTPGDNNSSSSLQRLTHSSASPASPAPPPPPSLPPPLPPPPQSPLPQSPPLVKQTAPSMQSSSSAIRSRMAFSLNQDLNIIRAFSHHIHSSGPFKMCSVRQVLAEDASLCKSLEGFQEGDGPKLNKKIYDRVRVLRKRAHKKSTQRPTPSLLLPPPPQSPPLANVD